MHSKRKLAFNLVSILAAAVLLLICGLTAQGVAVAQLGDEATSSGVEGKAALIVDASGSMTDADVDGGTRMDAAKQARTI